MPKRSSYQQKAISNYYKNRDAIMMQRLGELVTDLFLAHGWGNQLTAYDDIYLLTFTRE